MNLGIECETYSYLCYTYYIHFILIFLRTFLCIRDIWTPTLYKRSKPSFMISTFYIRTIKKAFSSLSYFSFYFSFFSPYLSPPVFSSSLFPSFCCIHFSSILFLDPFINFKYILYYLVCDIMLLYLIILLVFPVWYNYQVSFPREFVCLFIRYGVILLCLFLTVKFLIKPFQHIIVFKSL